MLITLLKKIHYKLFINKIFKNLNDIYFVK